MKVTEHQLKRLIKEEFSKIIIENEINQMSEGFFDFLKKKPKTKEDFITAELKRLFYDSMDLRVYSDLYNMGSSKIDIKPHLKQVFEKYFSDEMTPEEIDEKIKDTTKQLRHYCPLRFAKNNDWVKSQKLDNIQKLYADIIKDLYLNKNKVGEFVKDNGVMSIGHRRSANSYY